MTTPRRITLTEFRTCFGISLSHAERDGLLALHPGLRVAPSVGRVRHYDLTPDHHIGVLSLPTLTVEVRPKLPMQSALFVVSYGCDAVRWLPALVELASSDEIVDLVALLLARAIERATHRGLISGYRATEEPLRTPRGRLLFAEHLRSRLAQAPPIDVRYDAFTSDVIENRLLLAAGTSLLRGPVRAERVRHELRRALRAFGDVSLVRYAPTEVPKPPITRLNRHYAPALDLSRLVLQSAAVDFGSGGARGSAFLVDMNRAFETFVRRGLRQSLGLSPQMLPSPAPARALDDDQRVTLIPDLCVQHGGSIRWVGDVKYKALAAGQHRNSDIYQLLAYTVAHGLSSGTLIYASSGRAHSSELSISPARRSLHIVALDLAQPADRLLAQLDDVAERYVAPALATNPAVVRPARRAAGAG